MNFSIQTIIGTPFAELWPLTEDDFEELYFVASDPAIWEQHPNPDRWKREVFTLFFEGAMKSGGAFKIRHPKTGAIMGSTRFYDYNVQDDSIFIGYTFYATQYWGKGINPAVKEAMMDYIFQYVSYVYFHVGAENKRSLNAMASLGAKNLGEIEVAYFGELPRKNVLFSIEASEWIYYRNF
jgi:RimJ/RimL family protein N-acetyltransferase